MAKNKLVSVNIPDIEILVIDNASTGSAGERAVQIKNELPALFFRDFCCIITKEIVAWLYVLLFEKYGWKSIRDLIKQTPKVWQKRKIIMEKKRVGAEEMIKWFV